MGISHFPIDAMALPWCSQTDDPVWPVCSSHKPTRCLLLQVICGVVKFSFVILSGWIVRV